MSCSHLVPDDAGPSVLYFWHSPGLPVPVELGHNLNLTDMETCCKVFRRDVQAQIVIEEERFGVEPKLVAKLAPARRPDVREQIS